MSALNTAAAQREITARFVNPMPAEAAANSNGANNCIGTIQMNVRGAAPVNVNSNVYVTTTRPNQNDPEGKPIIPNPKIGDMCLGYQFGANGEVEGVGIFVFTRMLQGLNITSSTPTGDNPPRWVRINVA